MKVKLKNITGVDFISYIKPHLQSGRAKFIRKDNFDTEKLMENMANRKIFMDLYVSNWNKLSRPCKSKSDAKRRAVDIIKKGGFTIKTIEIKTAKDEAVIGVLYEFSKSQRLFYMFNI